MFWRRRKRLDEEMDVHLAEETADNVARGMDPMNARRAALRTFGNVEAAKERARELDPLYWLDTLWQDIRFAFRLIGRSPAMSVTIVATLTVGIALNVSVFTLLNGMLLRPWVQADPETFVAVYPRFSGEYKLRYSDGGLSQPDYVRYRDAAKSLASLSAYQLTSATLTGTKSGRTRIALVSCNLFDTIRGGPPLLGRYLRADECAISGDSPVAVVSESFWRSHLDADAAAIGRIVHVNRVPVTVVGVSRNVPLSVGPGSNQPELMIPYSMLGALRPSNDFFTDPRAQWLTVIGRRERDVPLMQVQQELAALARRADEEIPGRSTSLTVTDGSLAQMPEMRGKAALIMGLILGTTILLLVLACVNVATLLLSRSATRQREIAIRLSIGAGRFRLLRQLLTESLLLSGVSAAVSLAIAQQAPAALWRSINWGEAPFEMRMDMRVLLFCMAVAIGTGVMAGLSPAMESLRIHVSDSLKSTGASVTPGRRRSKLRSALVAVQVSISLLLVIVAGLFVRAQRNYLSYDPGFETKQVLSVTLASVLSGLEPSPSFYTTLESRVQAVPGVVQTSYVSIAPWLGRNSTELQAVDGTALPRTRNFRLDPARRLVTPEYFPILGMQLLKGRVFDRNGSRETVPVIVSESMAHRYWPNQDPIGRTFRTHAVHEVIGVCKDVQSIKFMENDGSMYYAPLNMPGSKPPVMLVRVSGDPNAAAARVRDIVRQVDPQMASTVVTLSSMIDSQAESLKPVLLHGSLAGGLALLLALTGVYGVVSFSVAQRIPEIGIRMALGAQRKTVQALVLRSGLVPVTCGLIAGLLLAIGAASSVKSMLFGFDAFDPLTFAVAPLALLAAALGAVWIPARRAARLDPLAALRHE